MGQTRRVIASLALLALGASCCLRGAEETAQEPGSVLTLKADATATVPGHPDILLGWGNVEIWYEDSLLQADRMAVWLRERQGYVEGNVRLVRGAQVGRAQAAFISWDEQKGILLEARLRVGDPQRRFEWFIGAEEVFQTGPLQFQAHAATFTTSPFTVPAHYFKADTLEVTADEKIIARNVVYYVRGVPVLYLPVIYRDMGKTWPWVRGEAGSSSRLGSYLSTQVGQSFEEHVDMSVDFSWLAKRGLAMGLNVDYDWPGIEGRLSSFYLPWDSGRDRNDLPLGTKDRWRYKFTHHQFVPQGWEFVGELQQYGDAGVREEFFEDEALEDKEVENRFYAKYARNNWDATGLVRYRTNDFFDTTQYLPRVGFDLWGQPLWDTLLVTVNTQLAYVERRFSELRTRPTANPYILPLRRWLWYREHLNEVDARRLRENAPLPYPEPLTARQAASDANGTARVHTQAEISLPLSVSPVKVEPFVVGRGTWYGETLPDGADAWRSQGGGGVRLSSQFWRAYDVVKPERDIFGLRHVITPELRVQSLSAPSVERFKLYEMDSLDELEREDRVTLALVNRLEVKGQDRKPRDILFFEADLDAVNRSSGRRTAALTTLRYSPFERLYFFLDTNTTIESSRLPYRPGLESLGAGLAFNPRSDWTVFLGNRYLRGDSSRTTLDITGRLSDRYTGRFYVEYDWRTRGDTEYGVSFQRDMVDFVVEFGIRHNQRTGETSFSVNLRLLTGRQMEAGRLYQRSVAERRDLILK